MIVYYLSSLAPITKSIVTTRHFSALEAETEKIRRQENGHGHFSVQQVEATPPSANACTKPSRKGGRHGQA